MDPATIGEAAGLLHTLVKTMVRVTRTITVRGRIRAVDKRVLDSVEFLDSHDCVHFVSREDKERIEAELTDLNWRTTQFLRKKQSHLNPVVIYRSFALAHEASELKQETKRLTGQARWKKTFSAYNESHTQSSQNFANVNKSTNENSEIIENGDTCSSEPSALQPSIGCVTLRRGADALVGTSVPVRQLKHILLTFNDGSILDYEIRLSESHPTAILDDTEATAQMSRLEGLLLDAAVHAFSDISNSCEEEIR